MRPREKPTERRRYPPSRRRDLTERRRYPSERERPRHRRRSDRSRRALTSRRAASPLTVPGTALVALAVFGAIAALRAAAELLGEWPLAFAALVVVVVGSLLGPVVVVHVAARIAARRVGAGR